MAKTDTIKIHSDIQIEVIGYNKKPKTNLDKDGKIASVETKWQSKKDNRVSLKRGQNVVPAAVAEFPMIKQLEAAGKITIDSSGVSKKKAKATSKKESTADEAAE